MPIKGFEFATSWPESDRLVERLADAVRGRQALTALDWTRVLLLTELTWTSTLVGAGTDFAPYLVAQCDRVIAAKGGLFSEYAEAATG